MISKYFVKQTCLFDYYCRGNSCPETALDLPAGSKSGPRHTVSRATHLRVRHAGYRAAPFEAPPLLILWRLQMRQKGSTPHLVPGSGLHSRGGQTLQHPRLLWAQVLNALLENRAVFTRQFPSSLAKLSMSRSLLLQSRLRQQQELNEVFPYLRREPFLRVGFWAQLLTLRNR